MSDERKMETYQDLYDLINDTFADVAKKLIAVRTFTLTMIEEDALLRQEISMLKAELEGKYQL